MLGVLLYSFTSHAYLNGEEGWPWYVFGQQRKGTAVDSGADSQSPEIVGHNCSNYLESMSCTFATLPSLSHNYAPTNLFTLVGVLGKI